MDRAWSHLLINPPKPMSLGRVVGRSWSHLLIPPPQNYHVQVLRGRQRPRLATPALTLFPLLWRPRARPGAAPVRRWLGRLGVGVKRGNGGGKGVLIRGVERL